MRLRTFKLSNGYELNICQLGGMWVIRLQWPVPKMMKDAEFQHETRKGVLGECRLFLAEQANPEIRRVRKRVAPDPNSIDIEMIRKMHKMMAAPSRMSNARFYVGAKTAEALRSYADEKNHNVAPNTGLNGLKFNGVIVDELAGVDPNFFALSDTPPVTSLFSIPAPPGKVKP